MNEIDAHFSSQPYKISSDDDGKVPLLREVFEKFPDTYINIDIKGISPILIQDVINMIIEMNREQYSFVGSMNPRQHKEISKLARQNNIRTYYAIRG